MSTAPQFSETNSIWATANEIERQFAVAIDGTFCLAFLLTAQADLAEECVIRSKRECLKCTRISKERLPMWIRNSIIRNGIAIVNESKVDLRARKGNGSIPLIPPSTRASIGLADYSAGILELNSFDRLAYVICVLEHYSSQHCALLLRSSREEVRGARIRALAHIAAFESRWHEAPIRSLAESPFTEPPLVSESSCGNLLD